MPAPIPISSRLCTRGSTRTAWRPRRLRSTWCRGAAPGSRTPRRHAVGASSARSGCRATPLRRAAWREGTARRFSAVAVSAARKTISGSGIAYRARSSFASTKAVCLRERAKPIGNGRSDEGRRTGPGERRRLSHFSAHGPWRRDRQFVRKPTASVVEAGWVADLRGRLDAHHERMPAWSDAAVTSKSVSFDEQCCVLCEEKGSSAPKSSSRSSSEDFPATLRQQPLNSFELRRDRSECRSLSCMPNKAC